MEVEFWKAWLHPWLAVSAFFPLCQMIHALEKEKKGWGDQLQSPLSLIGSTMFWGLVMGMLLSCLTTFFLFDIGFDEVILVWVSALFFACFGFRFLCFSHAIGGIGLIHLGVNQVEILRQWLDSYSSGKVLLNLSLIDWLWIVVLFHLCEWLLIRINGLAGRQIITVTHQSGHEVNGYLLNRIWPLPCVIFTAAGWIPVPLIAGFSSINLSKPIHQQKRFSSTYSLFHAGLLAIALWAVSIWPISLWFASLWALSGHELLFRYQKWKERQLQPFFTSDERGLKVLEVLPHSPAAQMGIRPGFILQEANDISINTIQDLERVTGCSAHCKLKLLDRQFDHHFVQKVVYEDDPKHLGIVGAIACHEVAATKEEDLDLAQKKG